MVQVRKIKKNIPHSSEDVSGPGGKPLFVITDP